MDISLGAEVRCADGPCGHLIYVIVEPRKKIVVCVVVQSNTMPYRERLVPIDSILASTPRKILLRCTREGSKDMEPFVETHYRPSHLPSYLMTSRQTGIEASEGSSSDELVIGPRIGVQAVDGHVGHLERFRVDPVTGEITHLIVRGEWPVKSKYVTVSASEIERIEATAIYLRSYRSVLDAQSPLVKKKKRRYRLGFD